MATSKHKQQGAARKQPPATAVPVMDVWDRIAWVSLHLLVVLVPIAMSNLGPFSPNGVPLTYDQFDIVKVFLQRGLLLFAVCAWVIGLLLRGGRVRFTRGEWLLLAFLGWLVLTTVFSVHPPTAIFGKYRRFEGLISFITYGAAFFMALQMVDSPARIRSIARSLVIGGFLVAAYGAIQVIGGVGLGFARVLQPVMVVLTVLVPAALGYLGFARGREDAELRKAYWIGAAVAVFGGIFLSAGLAENISVSVMRGLQTVALDPVQWGSLPFESNRAFSTFGNPDLLGGYLIFPWAVSLGLALSEKHETWRSIYWVLALFNVFVGITSYVRGAWIGATVSLVLMVVAYRRTRQGTQLRLSHTDWTFIGGTGMVALAVMIASSLRPDAVRNVLTRVLSIFQFGEGSAQTRFQIWEAARAAVAERPIFGWGADTFRLIFPMFKPAEYVEAAGYLSVADNVHNYPLQLASGIGVPGALLFYGLIGVALALAAKAAFAKGAEGRNLVLSGFWAAVAGYVMHLMFGLSVTGSTVFMWLAMGVLLVPSSKVRELRAPAIGVVLVPVMVVALVAGTFFNTRYITADMHYLQGRVMTQGAERVAEIERAIALNPYNEMYRLELGQAWRDLFRAAAEQYSQSLAENGTGDSELLQQTMELHARAAAAYEDVIEYVPQEYDTYVFLANVHNEAATYLDASYADKAIDAGKRGVAVEEYGPAIRVQLAIAYLLQDRVDEAIAELGVAT
ncbi:hypothetical protein EG835_01215, partial [bacterium]|nr:hypothetical protein [bacterium]